VDFFETVQRRRSIRRFTGEPIDPKAITKALEAAVWAPNSSNVQTWDFYVVRSAERKQGLVEACLKQSAARTASELVVITADPTRWRRSQPALVEWANGENAPKVVKIYYSNLVPWVYRWGFLNCLGLVKFIGITLVEEL